MDLPPAYRKALHTDTPERDLPLKKNQLQSLGEFSRKNFTDPRRANRTFPCWSLLVFIAIALLASRDNLAAVQRYGQFLTQGQRGWLRFPRNKDSAFRKVPATPPCATCSSKSIPTTWRTASTNGSRPTSEPFPAPWPSTGNGSAIAR